MSGDPIGTSFGHSAQMLSEGLIRAFSLAVGCRMKITGVTGGCSKYIATAIRVSVVNDAVRKTDDVVIEAVGGAVGFLTFAHTQTL